MVDQGIDQGIDLRRIKRMLDKMGWSGSSLRMAGVALLSRALMRRAACWVSSVGCSEK